MIQERSGWDWRRRGYLESFPSCRRELHGATAGPTNRILPSLLAPSSHAAQEVGEDAAHLGDEQDDGVDIPEHQEEGQHELLHGGEDPPHERSEGAPYEPFNSL